MARTTKRMAALVHSAALAFSAAAGTAIDERIAAGQQRVKDLLEGK